MFKMFPEWESLLHSLFGEVPLHYQKFNHQTVVLCVSTAVFLFALPGNYATINTGYTDIFLSKKTIYQQLDLHMLR